MKTKLLTVVLVFTFFCSNVNAQEFKLGKVSITELEEKEHPKDPSASAAILFKKGVVTFEYSEMDGFVVTTTVQTRIKIYKKEGYGFANQKMAYQLEKSLNEKVNFSEAYTYNLVGGKIEKTKLKSDGEFTENINKYWGRKKITMPNVKVGSVLEFESTVRTNIKGSLRDWYFQSSIPVNYSEFTTNIPEYYRYKTNQKGAVVIKTNVLKVPKNIILNNKERVSIGLTNKTDFSQEKINFFEIKSTYSAMDLAAMKEEVYVNNIDNYTSSISHELSVVEFPNSMPKHFSTDWPAVVKTIYDYDDFGAELNKTGYFEQDITALLSGKNSVNEKISAIFDFVKTSVKWNNYTGYGCNDGVKKAYKDKTGNVAEINLMLTAMLRYAGLNANPVLVSTRDNGIAFFPNRTAFNYVIAAVETPEDLILLDATEKYSQPNILPLRDLNWFGRLIRKDGSSTEVDLMPKTVSKISTLISVVLKSDGLVEGKMRKILSDHKALGYRNTNLLKNQDTYLEGLENENNKIEISDYTRENDLDLSKPISEVFAFRDTKSVEIINDKIYISPLLFLAAKENPFKQEERKFPVDFGYPWLEKHTVNIEIPEGYVVESLPSALNLRTGEDIGSFVYKIINHENRIQTVITSTINIPIVQSDFYPILKDYYQQLTDKQNEKIVLKKI